MTKAKSIPSGVVVLMDKSKLPKQEQPTIKKLSQTSIDSVQKPKRVQSEAQKANLARLVALNKQRALERRGITEVDQSNIPSAEEIPEDKELVYIKPKKPSTRLPKSNPVLERQNAYMVDVKAEKVKFGYRPNGAQSEQSSRYRPNGAQSEQSSRYPPPPPPPRPTKPSRPKSKKQPVSYYEETSEDEEKTETETETDTDTEINRYSKKVQKRTSVLSKIEEELNQLKSKMNQSKAVVNPYSKHSIF